MSSKLMFADNITMSELNPHNFALKNDYISNLVSTALAVIPYANLMLGKDKVFVTNGFLSRSYIQQELNLPKRKVEDMYKHAEGKALEITWEDFDVESAINLTNYMIPIFVKEEDKVKMVIDSVKGRVSFYFDSSKLEVGEETKEGYRVIKQY